MGTRIGMRILNSEHVQKAVASQDTAERIYDISRKVESHIKKTPVDELARSKNAASTCNSTFTVGDGSLELYQRRSLSKPIHSMWTSPAAAVRQKSEISMGACLTTTTMIHVETVTRCL